MDAPAGRIAAMWRYPVKSLAGEPLEESLVTPRGLLGDRGHALIDAETGKVASAKNPRRWPGLLDGRAAYAGPPHPGRPLPPARITLGDGSTFLSDAPDAAARLGAALGRPVRLATAPAPGATAEGYWPDHDWLPGPDRDAVFEFPLPPGTFFDGAMVHLVTTATLDALSRLAPGSRVEPARFRPNLLIATPPDAEGFVEDAWIGRDLRIGEVVLRIEGPCPRCVMTTLAQADLPPDPSVLRAAVTGNAGHVGIYATALRGGAVRRGDAVRLA